MNKLRLLSRGGSLLLLLWVFLGNGLAAEQPQAPAAEELEVDRAPAPEPVRKRGRHRADPPRQNERVEVGKDVIVRSGEVVRDVVVIAGNAIIDGTVEGDLVVVSGSARITGQVDRNLVTILGSATLGPDASVGHDAVVVGGTLRKDPLASIGGQQTVIALGPPFPDFLWLQGWLSQGLFLARPFPPHIKWVWVAASVFALFYLALTLIFPRPVRACVTALDQQPVASFFIGTLLMVLLGPLLFLLVISLAGILVIPFIVCALGVAMVLGKMAVYTYAGQRLAGQRNSRISLPIVLLLGLVLFYVLYMVPVLGFAVWGVVTLLGLGAVLLAAFGSFRQETAPAYAPVQSLAVAVPPMETAAGGTAGPPPIVTVTLSPVDLALLPRVGFWRRLCATFLDFILVGITLPVTGPFFLGVWPAYHVALWAWKGTTIGGIVMGIKVVRLDGQPVDFAVALVRSLASFFSAFALFLGFFWAGWDRERQAWHDKIAGTIVVKVPKGISLI